MVRLGVCACVVLTARVVVADPPKPAAHYAKLFTPNATWKVEVSLTSWDGDKIAAMEAKGIDTSKMPSSKYPRATTTERFACRVARVAKLVTATASEIVCDKDFAPYVHLAGIYVANARGLFDLAEFPASESDLPTQLDEPRMTATPKPRKVTTPIDMGGRIDGKAVETVRRRGAAWCRSRQIVGSSIGHNGVEEQCFAGGLPSGTHDFGPELQIYRYRAR